MTSHVVIDTATILGKLGFDVARRAPFIVEWRTDLRNWEGYTREQRDRYLADTLVRLAEEKGLVVLTEHAQAIEGNVIRRWALAVEPLPAPPDPRLEPHPWRSGA